MRRRNLAFCNEKTRLLRREVYPKAKRGTPFHEPELNGRVDQAQRIHRGEQRSPVAFCAVVDPLRLIHPTTATRFMVRVQFWQRQYRQLAMTGRVMF